MGCVFWSLKFGCLAFVVVVVGYNILIRDFWIMVLVGSWCKHTVCLGGGGEYNCLVRWARSFLVGRTNCVRWRGVTSGCLETPQVGVPQGTGRLRPGFLEIFHSKTARCASRRGGVDFLC